MLTHTISSGSAEIILTGTAIQFNRSPISLDLNFDDLNLNIIIEFENDFSTNKQHISADTLNKTSLHMKFFNFNNPLGSGSSSPVNIGTYEDKIIYFNFRVYTISDNSDKSLHYTFYLSKEII